MKKIFSILFILVLVVSLGLATTTPALAGTIRYVPSVYPTIQAAIDAASAGDTIMVAAGNYDAFQVVDKNNISIISTEGATVTTADSIFVEVGPLALNGSVMAAVFDSEYINIQGINFNGSGVNATDIAGIIYVDSTGNIAHLTVSNITGSAWYVCGVGLMSDVGLPSMNLTDVTVENSFVDVAVLHGDVNIHGCTITGTPLFGAGIMVGWPLGPGFEPSTVNIQGSAIFDNWCGIWVCDNSTVQVHFNNITGNAGGGLSANPDSIITTEATDNWWGDASGPYEETLNPDGLGDAVFGNVDFEPWLAAPPAPVTETVTNGTVDAIDEADTEVAVNGTATVTVDQYSENPGGAPPTNWKALGAYIDVYVPDTGNVTEIEIRLYYTDAQVAAAGVPEESLRLDWWNGAAWVHCSDSGVNMTSIYGYSGYTWAKIRNNTIPSLANLLGTGFASVGYQAPSQPPTGGCFIATAAYGTDTARELDILREFRDTVLLPNSLGAKFVSFYYRTSPPIASFISQHEFLRTAVRVGFVDPIVKILKWTHDLWSARGS